MTRKIRPHLPRRGHPGAGRAPWPIRFFAELGPGLITGAADDDPSGISTYSVAGAAFGYAPLWTAVFSFPLMAAVQLMCAAWPNRFSAVLANATSVTVDKRAAMNRAPGNPPSR